MRSRFLGSSLAALLLGATVLGGPLLHADDAAGLGKPADERATVGTIIKAVQAGDLETVANLYKTSTDPAIHVIAATAIERLHFNLEESNKDAQRCEDGLIDSRPGLALFCGQFQSGNLRLAGRFKEADAKETALVARFAGHRVDPTLAQMKTYVAGNASRQLAVDVPPGDFTLPYVRPERESDRNIAPKVKAEANGHHFDLLLDSGANDLWLGEEQAKTLGVEILPGQMLFSGWLTEGATGRTGLLRELKVGPVTWHNLRVFIVPNPIALLGANMLAPLGTLRFTQHALVVGASARGDTRCDSPMLTGSNVYGTILRLLPAAQIEDQWRTVLLDTGASRYLVGTADALQSVTVLRRSKAGMGDIGGYHDANTRQAKVKITLSGQPIEVYFDVYADSHAIMWPITIGAGAMRDMDFLVDFNQHRLCFALHPDLR